MLAENVNRDTFGKYGDIINKVCDKLDMYV